ncbi:tetratricopeptide repeat protein [Roseimaritima sediminicola]|uniref:tetratricopeptide repeat protein n=1 Tax=Roseimaritima sediminicola TaxID=2662066 RepID=UPI0012983EBB|nr:tetratricopeptide repeat protein [Roseimaritima sediminicola]
MNKLLLSRLARLSSPWLWFPLLVCGLCAVAVLADYLRPGLPANAQASYVGRQTCAQCHQEEFEKFVGSHHDLAMDVANEDTVLGDFDDVTFEHDGITSRMFRSGERFMIHTEGPDGELADFEIKYVFGVTPLQQYMVEFDRTEAVAEDEIARLQVLRISWDTLRKRWFYLRPPDVQDKLEPDDQLHWTGIAQRWQTMCAECHSTNLVRGFDHQDLTYHTTFSEIDVSCEACHGPASLHVELANRRSLFWDREHGYGLTKLKAESNQPQIDACAPCHSRRGLLAAGHQAGDAFCDHFNLELLREQTYFADGQVKDEDYVYGSFIQSRMYHKNIRCTDCHDPHSLKLKFPGNATCTSCHQHPAAQYDTPAHHHHAVGTPGAACVNCHMPTRTYMDVDVRRDHSLRIPRPDLSVALGTPNACTACHIEDRLEQVPEDQRAELEEYADWQAAAEAGDETIAALMLQTDRWSDEACDRWYGANRRRDPHFAEPITALRRGQTEAIDELLERAKQPNIQTAAIARATILDELTGHPQGLVRSVTTAEELLEDETQEPMVRAAAIRLLAAAPLRPVALGRLLVPLLSADSRLERHEAAVGMTQAGIYGHLTASQRQRLDIVLLEVRESLMASNDRAGSHLAWAMLCEQRGLHARAMEAYETAIRVEPERTGARANLAALLDRLAAGDVTGTSPETQAQRAARAKQLRSEELPLLERDANLVPDNAMLQYRLGLAYYLDGQMDEALAKLQRAVELSPEDESFQEALRLLKEKLAESAATVEPRSE